MAVQQVAEAERIRREEEERLRAEQAAFEAAAAVPLSSIGKLLGQQATAPPKRRPKVIVPARKASLCCSPWRVVTHGTRASLPSIAPSAGPRAWAVLPQRRIPFRQLGRMR